MRKIVLTLCSVALFSFFAAAQITKGSKLLGGGISFGRTKSEPSSNTNLTKLANTYVSLSAGVATKENLIVGGSLQYGHSTYRYTNSDGTPQSQNTSNNYGAGGFARRYFPLGKNFYLFGQTGLNFGLTNEEHLPGTNEKTETEGWNIRLSVEPGISYAVTRKFHLELGFNDLASLHYGQSVRQTTGSTAPAKSKSTSYGFSTFLSTYTPLNIGFRVLIQK